MTQLTNIRGVIRGRTIELEQELSVPDGAEVTISIRTTVPDEEAKQRLLEAFGALADCSDEVDEFNAWYRAERHRGTERMELPE